MRFTYTLALLASLLAAPLAAQQELAQSPESDAEGGDDDTVPAEV